MNRATLRYNAQRAADARLRAACHKADLRLEKLRQRDDSGEPLYYLTCLTGIAVRMEPPMSMSEAWDEVRARL